MGGNSRQINELAEISRDSAGKPALVFGTSQDVTERLQAEEILRQSEKKYRTLIESASEGIFVIQDGKIPFANPKAFEIIGYPAEEMTRRNFLDFVFADDRQEPSTVM